MLWSFTTTATNVSNLLRNLLNHPFIQIHKLIFHTPVQIHQDLSYNFMVPFTSNDHCKLKWYALYLTIQTVKLWHFSTWYTIVKVYICPKICSSCLADSFIRYTSVCDTTLNLLISIFYFTLKWRQESQRIFLTKKTLACNVSI